VAKKHRSGIGERKIGASGSKESVGRGELVNQTGACRASVNAARAHRACAHQSKKSVSEKKINGENVAMAWRGVNSENGKSAWRRRRRAKKTKIGVNSVKWRRDENQHRKKWQNNNVARRTHVLRTCIRSRSTARVCTLTARTHITLRKKKRGVAWRNGGGGGMAKYVSSASISGVMKQQSTASAVWRKSEAKTDRNQSKKISGRSGESVIKMAAAAKE